jgi:hypothetical protein
VVRRQRARADRVDLVGAALRAVGIVVLARGPAGDDERGGEVGIIRAEEGPAQRDRAVGERASGARVLLLQLAAREVEDRGRGVG